MVWPCKTKPQYGIAWPEAALTTHVDDLATSSKEKWLNEKFKSMEIKFGKLTRETLPFQHCGCKYSKITDGFRVDQAEYVKTLKNVDVPKDKEDDTELDAYGIHLLRGVE